MRNYNHSGFTKFMILFGQCYSKGSKMYESHIAGS